MAVINRKKRNALAFAFILVLIGCAPPAPYVDSLEASRGDYEDRIVLGWRGGNQDYFNVYRSETEGTLGDLIATVFSAASSLGGYSYVDREVAGYDLFFYTVEAYVGDYYEPVFSSQVSGYLGSSALVPGGLAASVGAFADRVRLTWNEVAAAAIYRIERRAAVYETDYVRIGSTDAESYDDATAEAGVSYEYRVRGESSGGVISLPGSVVAGYALLAGGGNFAAVSCGNNHSLALRADGRLYACGLNSSGQLGAGDFVSRAAWTETGPGSTVLTAVAAGADYSFAVASDGSLYACGYNGDAVFGVAPSANVSAWTKVNGALFSAAAVSVGDAWVLALDSTGRLWASGFWPGSGDPDAVYEIWTDITPSAASATRVAGRSFLGADGLVRAWNEDTGGWSLVDGPASIATIAGKLALTADGRAYRNSNGGGFTEQTALGSTVVSIWGGRSERLAAVGAGPTLWTAPDSYSSFVGIPLPASTAVASLSLGDHHALFVDGNGALWIEGGDGAGETGSGRASFPYWIQTTVVLP